MQGGRSLAYLNEHDPARELLNRSLAIATELGDHRRRVGDRVIEDGDLVGADRQRRSVRQRRAETHRLGVLDDAARPTLALPLPIAIDSLTAMVLIERWMASISVIEPP